MMNNTNIHISKGTNTLVAERLHDAYINNKTVRIFYGNIETGEDELRLYGVVGILTSSNGVQPVFKLDTDIGLVELETDKIVKLEISGKTVYTHPFYHVPTLEIVPLSNSTMMIKSGEKVIVSGVSFERARYIFKFINSDNLQ